MIFLAMICLALWFTGFYILAGIAGIAFLFTAAICMEKLRIPLLLPWFLLSAVFALLGIPDWVAWIWKISIAGTLASLFLYVCCVFLTMLGVIRSSVIDGTWI